MKAVSKFEHFTSNTIILIVCYLFVLASCVLFSVYFRLLYFSYMLGLMGDYEATAQIAVLLLFGNYFR